MGWVALVAFFDIISFFAVASLFAWLGYGPLLREKEISQGLGTLTDYFMFSFWFYAVSAVMDYVLHHTEGIIYFWVEILVGAAFALGTLTLIVAAIYVRRFGKTGFSETDIPPFKFTMQLTYYLTSGVIAALSGVALSHTVVGFGFFTLTGILACWGGIGYAKSWRKPSNRYRRLMTYPVLVTFLWIVVSIVMFVLFGWPM